MKDHFSIAAAQHCDQMSVYVLLCHKHAVRYCSLIHGSDRFRLRYVMLFYSVRGLKPSRYDISAGNKFI